MVIRRTDCVWSDFIGSCRGISIPRCTNVVHYSDSSTTEERIYCTQHVVTRATFEIERENSCASQPSSSS